MTQTGRQSPSYLLYRSFWVLLDWLFPPVCGGCDQPGERWCGACQASVELVHAPLCPCCGEPQAANRPCANCRAEPPAYTALRSWGRYSGALRSAIIRLKFHNDMGLGEALSKHLVELYNGLQWDVHLIVPVPLSPARVKQRGYNQSGLLARPFAYALYKPYQPGALIRARDTLSQMKLSAQERRRNVANAFQADPERVSGKTILLIDDVTTTGSTISACAQALSAAGATSVYGLTLARSILQTDLDDQQVQPP